MMDAHPQEELLSALVDDALPPAEKEAVTRHISRCDQCRLTVARLQAVRDSLRNLPQEPVPSGWREALLARVAQEEGAAPSQEANSAEPARKPAGWAARLGVLAGAAAVLLLMVVGGMRLLVPAGPGSPAGDEIITLSEPFIAMERAETTDEPVPELDGTGDAGAAGVMQDTEDTPDTGDTDMIAAEQRPRRRVVWTVLASVLTTLGVTISLLIVVTRGRRAPPPA